MKRVNIRDARNNLSKLVAAAQMHGCGQLWTNDNRPAAASDGLAAAITQTHYGKQRP